MPVSPKGPKKASRSGASFYFTESSLRSRGSGSFEFLESQQVLTRRPILIFRNVP
jgi:hypothetical protein